MLFRSCLVALVLITSLFAQEPTPISGNPSTQAAPPTIVSRTQLVLVPVLVRDKSGKHIENLTKDAFRIEENGKEQTIASFEELRTVTVPPVQRPNTATVYSNYSQTDSRAYRATIIVLDLVNTPGLSQHEAIKELLKYLSSSLRQDEPTALFVLRRHGLRQIASLTTDPTILIEAVKKVPIEVDQGSAVGSAMESLDIAAEERLGDDKLIAIRLKYDLQKDNDDHEVAMAEHEATVKTLEALNVIARAYAAIPGRKTLIWATSGFPFMIDDPHSFARLGVELTQQYEDTWRELVAANIAVYPIDAEGIVDPNFHGGDMDLRRTRLQRGPYANIARVGNYDPHEQRQATMRAFAAATGGRPCIDTNDMEKCFSMAVEDSSAYYLLSYYLKPEDRAPGWRKLNVKVSAPGAHVSARQGFYVSGPIGNAAEQERKLVASALHSPVEFTGVHLAVQPVTLPPDSQTASEGKIRQRFLVQIAPTSIAMNRRTSEINIDIGMFAVNERDQLVGQISKSLNTNLKPEMVANIARNGAAVDEDLDLPPGAYVIKAIVRDNLSGQIGTVNFPLQVKTPVKSTQAPATSK